MVVVDLGGVEHREHHRHQVPATETGRAVGLGLLLLVLGGDPADDLGGFLAAPDLAAECGPLSVGRIDRGGVVVLDRGRGEGDDVDAAVGLFGGGVADIEDVGARCHGIDHVPLGLVSIWETSRAVTWVASSV